MSKEYTYRSVALAIYINLRVVLKNTTYFYKIWMHSNHSSNLQIDSDTVILDVMEKARYNLKSMKYPCDTNIHVGEQICDRNDDSFGDCMRKCNTPIWR